MIRSHDFHISTYPNLKLDYNVKLDYIKINYLISNYIKPRVRPGKTPAPWAPGFGLLAESGFTRLVARRERDRPKQDTSACKHRLTSHTAGRGKIPLH